MVKSPQSRMVSPGSLGLWVKTTPDPDSLDRFPNFMDWMVTAVPQSSEIPIIFR